MYIHKTLQTATKKVGGESSWIHILLVSDMVSLWLFVEGCFFVVFFYFFSFRGSCSLTELCAYSKVQSADASNRVAEMLRPRHHSTYYKSLDHQNHSKTVLDAALTSMAHWLSVCILVLTLQHSLTRSKVYPIVFIGIHTC